jgi:large subunit ribosomal protein L3e
MNLLKNLRQKRNNIFEVQINGGKNIEEKVDFGYNFFEKEVKVDQVFNQN